MRKLPRFLLIALALSRTCIAAETTERTPEWAKWYQADAVDHQKAIREFHIDSVRGDDSHDGKSPETAWKTLKRLNEIKLLPGDHVLLRRGSRFNEALELNQVTGTPEAFVRILASGPEAEAKPVIDGKGHEAAIHLANSRYVRIDDLEIINDNSQPIAVTKGLLASIPKEKKGAKRTVCHGVWITAADQATSSDIHLKGLNIHNIFPVKASSSEGRINMTFYGQGITIANDKESAGTINRIVVSDCLIGNTGHFGILTSGPADNKVRDLIIRNNRTSQTGGSAFLAANAANCYVFGNVFDGSGAFDDARKHGRGSGSWTFAAENVLYEKNVCMNSKGKGDSAGIHIDFNCRDVIVQRNFSYNNEGGFMEVLGNNYNCAYRYNVSVNDGSRIKGKDGAVQEGKVLMVSGHCMKAPFGPFNSYFYNNTIYADERISPKFSITGSAEGLLIANNIFCLNNAVSEVDDDQPTSKAGKKAAKMKAKNVVFENNIYPAKTTLPSSIGITDANMIIADPQYTNAGGKLAADYIPRNKSVIKDKGVMIGKLPGDEIGLKGGLQVDSDFFGKPIVGKPDIGAIEID